MVAMILLYEVCMYVKFDTSNNITKKYQILLQVIHNSRFMCKVQVQNLCLTYYRIAENVGGRKHWRIQLFGLFGEETFGK